MNDDELALQLSRTLVKLIREVVRRDRSESATETRTASGGMPLAPKFLYSLKEAAAALSLSISSLRELLRCGILKGSYRGRRVLIHRDEIERFARKKGTVRIWGPKRDGKTARFKA